MRSQNELAFWRRSVFSLIRGRLLLAVLPILAGSIACQKPNSERQASEPSAEPPVKADSVPIDPPPDRLTIGVEPDESETWLRVEAVRGDAKGAWATGTFDPQRNRLEITTKDVEKFSICVERIPIDWDRLVVIRLDGRNSELRRREQAVYYFSLDEHGRWAVAEH